jgi:tetratricopeptide (TPR) repeat protein
VGDNQHVFAEEMTRARPPVATEVRKNPSNVPLSTCQFGPVNAVCFREVELKSMSSQAPVTPDRAVLAGMVLTAAVYCRDLQYDFILDDLPLILMNETITSWKNWTTLFVSQIVPTQGVDIVAVHYRPVYTLWLMANYQSFGMVLPWWHLTSLLLHLFVCLVMYKVGVRVLKEPWTAALATLLFAFHPIHVESVSYVSASTDLLVAMFMLLAFLAYSRFREESGSLWYLAASVLTAALAMLSKETAVVFPLALVAYEILREHPPAPQRWRNRLIWTLPFFGVVAAYATARTLLFGGNVGPGPGADRLSALWDGPLVLLVYLRNLLWPVRLSFFYPLEWSAQWTLGKGVAAALVLVAAAFLWKRYQERLGVRLLLLWTAILFLIPVASVSALRKQDWVHDRHMYLVSVPFCLITAVVLTDRKLPRKTSIAAGSLLAATLLIITAVEVPRFKDELSVYESALKVAPRNVLLRRRYVAALWNSVPRVTEPSPRRDQALREFLVNIELWPELELGYENYGAALAELGRNEEAATQYKRALLLDTGGPTHLRGSILYRLAELDLKLSKLEEAENCLREALAIDPNAMSYHALLAEVLKQRGKGQEADEQMKMEVSIKEEFIRQHSTPKAPLIGSPGSVGHPKEIQ